MESEARSNVIQMCLSCGGQWRDGEGIVHKMGCPAIRRESEAKKEPNAPEVQAAIYEIQNWLIYSASRGENEYRLHTPHKAMALVLAVHAALAERLADAQLWGEIEKESAASWRSVAEQLKAQLAINPACPRGHRRADWVEAGAWFPHMVCRACAELEAEAKQMIEAAVTEDQISWPRCKKCSAFITYHRVTTHGVCKNCELGGCADGSASSK